MLLEERIFEITEGQKAIVHLHETPKRNLRCYIEVYDEQDEEITDYYAEFPKSPSDQIPPAFDEFIERFKRDEAFREKHRSGREFQQEG